MIFDLNIVGGSHYFLSQDTTGLLFIPVEGNDIFIWTDVLQDTNITIGVEAVHILGTNRWTITVQGKTLPENLIQQGKNNDIELPVSFTKGKGDTFIVLCKINLKKTDYKIENRKPFIPLEILEQQINSYDEVITILESINNPISRSVFTESAIVYNGNYTFVAAGQPLAFQQ